MQCSSFEDIEELNSMTLQVGLAGIDGLVIASDRLTSGWEGVADRNISTISKFRLGNGFICCWSGDDVAQLSAANICKLNVKNKLRGASQYDATQIIRKGLESAGGKAWTQKYGRERKATNGTVRKVIAACPDGHLWLLEFINRTPTANQKLDKVVAGDIKNSAGLFIKNYLPAGYAPIQLPVKQLIFAAAHAVLVGAIENPSGVGGLEVAVIRKDSPPIFLSTQQEEQLKELSKQLNTMIENRLTYPFDCGAAL
jgi:hypothetical protein